MDRRFLHSGLYSRPFAPQTGLPTPNSIFLFRQSVWCFCLLELPRIIAYSRFPLFVIRTQLSKTQQRTSTARQRSVLHRLHFFVLPRLLTMLNVSGTGRRASAGENWLYSAPGTTLPLKGKGGLRGKKYCYFITENVVRLFSVLYCIQMLPYQRKPHRFLSTKLARFHHRGRNYDVQSTEVVRVILESKCTDVQHVPMKCSVICVLFRV